MAFLNTIWKILARLRNRYAAASTQREEPGEKIPDTENPSGGKTAVPSAEVWRQDENGQLYREETRIVRENQKLYIRGLLKGKYHGSRFISTDTEEKEAEHYDIDIYEARIYDWQTAAAPFPFKGATPFPREKLPETFDVLLESNGNLYSVTIYGLHFDDLQINQQLHQKEGDDVYGVVEGWITGYMLNEVEVPRLERLYKTVEVPPPQQQREEIPAPATEKSRPEPTGRMEQRQNYSRKEYIYPDTQQRYFGPWHYNEVKNKARWGCLPMLGDIFLALLLLVALLFIVPNLGWVTPLIIFALLFRFIRRLLIWIAELIGFLLLVVLVVFIVQLVAKPADTFLPRPLAVDSSDENMRLVPIKDTLHNSLSNDTLIQHFRQWKDAYGNRYAGTYGIKKSDWLQSARYKENLDIAGNGQADYNRLLFQLKENDRNRLGGLYAMFDSLQLKHHYNRWRFANMVVSFVQDIPYVVILPEACDPTAYQDAFIRKYLSSSHASCEGYQKYGITTPVEFMATLKGDCDSRTLLLYTLLAHYGYDVAVLSSEKYGHSLLGINVPVAGASYPLPEKHYVLWETTSPDIPAGIIPREIADMNYWNLSLQSQ